MIVSSDPILNSGSNVATEGILEIHQEILLIDRHKREHISNDGEIKQPESSCQYCQRHRHLNEKPVDTKLTSGKQDNRENNRKKIGSLNEIERTVNISGKNGSVLVPRTWLGKRVRIVLIDPDAQ
jgi:hypothetical protein